MQQFYFYVYRKITTWTREKHSISAETKENAINKMIIEFKDNELDDTDTYIEQEHLFECDTLMDIEDNNGNATAELYYDADNGMEFIIDNLKNVEI